MLLFQIRLALNSFRKAPMVMSLVAAMIAVSIGVLMTSFAIYHFMSKVPLSHKLDTLYAVQLDTWRDWPHETHLKMLSYKDVTRLMQSDIPTNHSASFFSRFILGPESSNAVNPYYVIGRVTTPGLFNMFEAPFLYGGPWSQEDDNNGMQLVVINKKTNEKMFGGENSVGKNVVINKRTFQVVGVLDDWVLTPRLYDMVNMPYLPTEDVFIPFSMTESMQLTSMGNIQMAMVEGGDDPFTAMINSESIWIPYWVEFDSVADVERYRTFLTNYTSEQQALGRFDPGHDSGLKPIDERVKFHNLVSDTNTLIVGLAALFVLVCSINIMGLLSAKNFARMKEFSIYRSLGAKRSVIIQMQIVEVLVLGLLCGVVSILCSYAGLSLVKNQFSHFGEVARMDVQLLTVTVLLSVVVCLLAYLYPAIKASRVNPVAYIK